MNERFQGYLSRSLRKLLLNILSRDKELAAQSLQPFFSFAVECVRLSYISKKDILDLFEDLFECCPEQKLQEVFPLFQNSVMGSTTEEVQEEGKIQLEETNLHYCTKICRTIMSKLTVTHDLQFRGTIQMFLAKTLPLTHRSGCNVRGFLNTSNTTHIDDSVDPSTDDGGFYLKFWTLQKFLNNPVLLFKPHAFFASATGEEKS